MMLLVRPDRVSGGSQAIATFGVGLIGSAIVRALCTGAEVQQGAMPFSWHDPGRWRDQFAMLSQRLEGLGRLATIDIVWSAGPAGFGARQSDLAPELAAYEAVLGWSDAVTTAFPGARVGFHLLSSAGGLFEGQRFVEADTTPQPLRPYGEAKLQQEDRLRDLPARVVTHVYRPSSVYGFNGFGGRAGLLNTLIGNARRHTSSRIFGGLDTVRDYVLSSDIGAFIAGRIAAPEASPRPHILASGKPTSMMEILQIARHVVGSPLQLKFDTTPSNASHITYRPSALPADWRPTDLQTGVRQMARQLSQTFEAGAKRP